MPNRFFKIVIELLLKLPKTRLKYLDGPSFLLLNFLENGPIRTRYGFYIYFSRIGKDLVRYRKSVVLGRYEDSDMSVLKKLLDPGDMVIDGGANEGYVSLFLSQIVGDNGKVFSIEPNEENLDYFRKNIELNSIKNIVVIKKALGDKCSDIPYYCNADEGAAGSVIKSVFPDSPQKVIMAKGDTLDNISCEYNVIDKISLIKLDIEGNELKAFLGAERLLSTSRPHLLFEVNLTIWSHLPESIDTLFDFLKSKGYELFIVKNKKFIPYRWLELRVANFFAVHKSRIEQLSKKNIL
jgi:FkbM family methyltransferase